MYADDACIVSRSPHELGRMTAIFVEVFGTFGLTISGSKSETMCMLIHGATVPPDNPLHLYRRHSD